MWLVDGIYGYGYNVLVRLVGGVVRRYIDILTIIINFPYSTCISSFLAAASLFLCSFLKCFFVLYKFRLQQAIKFTFDKDLQKHLNIDIFVSKKFFFPNLGC